MSCSGSRRPDAAAGLAALVLAFGVGLAAPAAALPVISEVLYDAAGSDDGLVFVEIFGAPATDLTGMTIEGVNGADGSVGPVIALVGTIPADGIFVLADEASGGGTLVPDADQLANFDLQNGPDSVVLRSGPSVLDALGYGEFDPGEVFAGEGSPAPDPAAGSSLARTFADVDTDDNAADFTVLAVPTPGTATLLAVPEPGSHALLALGLALMAPVRRALRLRAA